MGPDRARVAAAEALLGCRRGASRAEVQSAYRAALRRERPDLGCVDGHWLPRLHAARDVLLGCAPPDRRRRPRRTPALPASVLPLRRATWGLVEAAAPRVEVHL